MLSTSFVLHVLDTLRAEAVQAAENPAEEYRTEFGAGRVAGMLQALSRAKGQIEEEIEAGKEASRRGDDQPHFEGESG